MPEQILFLTKLMRMRGLGGTTLITVGREQKCVCVRLLACVSVGGGE